ncbi:uncharacterized protein F4822DRAFT_427494 [Hypoxylon trugodes]|uniref:uncharacterized protein n=1 Tax=Hypoxylon trugodes TaxID=326681 RepID=UPI00219DF392|nr:uncharacterized protein F4822DRAFT_427494 [Hypoxylon trugodes]KAI1391638.1 hypothetical protein F4822DRAFT_427494 [Hypoxylon trugodes]
MPIDQAVNIIKEIADKLNDLTGNKGHNRRDLYIAGPVDTRDIIDTDSAPRVALTKWNNSDEGLCGVPQYNFDMCRNALAGITITQSMPTYGQARFDNILPSCMVLSTVLAGTCDPGLGPHPILCGSACLMYTDLTDEQLDKLEKALGQ